MITTPPCEECRKSLILLRRAGTLGRLLVYASGLLIGTTLVGAAFGWLGTIVSVFLPCGVALPIWSIAIALAALPYGFHELSIFRLPFPQIRWQVPAHWVRYGQPVWVFFYGLILGVDVLTLMNYATFYVLALIEAAGGAGQGARFGLLYGLARLLPTAAGVVVLDQRHNAFEYVHWILSHRRAMHILNGIALLVVSAVLLTALLSAR